MPCACLSLLRLREVASRVVARRVAAVTFAGVRSRSFSEVSTGARDTSEVVGDVASLVKKVEEAKRTRRRREAVGDGTHSTYTERYVPVTRAKLTSMLAKDLPEGEREDFWKFSESLDSALLPHYHTTLEDIQMLYEPLNPDRDTLTHPGRPSLDRGRGWEDEEAEEWDLDWEAEEEASLALTTAALTEPEGRLSVFLRRLAELADAANFSRLSDEAVAYALTRHHPLDGPQVSVNLDRYEVVAFWAIGSRTSRAAERWRTHGRRWMSWIPWTRASDPWPERRIFTRVLVAARLKGGRLMLKAFKDVPWTALELTLPEVRVHMSTLDKTLVNGTLAIGGLAVFVNVYMVIMTDLKVQLMLVLALFSLLLGARTLSAYRRRRARYTLGLARMLYYKGTANNGALVTALARRALHEHCKDVLLARAAILRLAGGGGAQAASSVSPAAVSLEVERWLESRCGLRVSFRPHRALRHLEQAGLLDTRPVKTQGPQAPTP
ncbi:transmembrane protein 143 isoform X1 [Lampetra fluviatilis]